MRGLAPGSLRLLLPCLLILPVAGAELGAPDSEGWRQLSLLEASHARDAFGSAAQARPSDRNARLGEALALLQARTRTAANLDRAEGLLANLRRENADDDPGVAALYYQARIAQVHRFTPDRAGALAGYRALIAGHPHHHYAELAAPKLAILLLYDDVAPAAWEKNVGEVQALLPRLSAPEARRDTRLILATALIRLRRDHARAYPLLTACLADGAMTRMPHLNATLLQAAESAHQLGRTQEEAGWYARFLAEFPQDSRADEIRRRLQALTEKQETGA